MMEGDDKRKSNSLRLDQGEEKDVNEFLASCGCLPQTPMSMPRFERETEDAGLVCGLAIIAPSELAASQLALRDETRRRWWCMFGQPQLNDASRLYFFDILVFYTFEEPFRVHTPSHQDLFSLPEAQLPQVVQCKCSRYIDGSSYRP